MPAPYSDNLYSADDSDVDVDVDVADDDLAAHLSPTDGYFHSTSSSAGDLYPPQQQHQQQVYDFPRDNVTDATLPTSAGVPHVPNVLVQDPSLQKGASSSKDREAREETRLNTDVPLHQSTSAIDDLFDGASTADSEATPSHTTYTSHPQSPSSYTPYAPSTDAPLRTPQTHPRRSLYSSTASLFRVPREAPPAYTPSPTSPLSSSPTGSRNYRTFSSIMGAPEEERRLLGRDPESMGDEPYDDDDDDDGHRRPLPWRERALRKVPLASRRTVKMVLLVILVFVTFAGFLSALTSTVVSWPDKTPSKQPAKGYDPVTGLPIHTGPEAPSQPSDPSKPSQPGVPGHPTEPLPWNPQSMCAKNEHRFSTRVFNIAFEADKTLSVVQGVEAGEPGRGYQPHVQGSFVVRRQLSNASGPTIELEVVANDPALDVTVEWDSDAQHLDIKTPQRIEWNQSLRPCITVRATVWVPEDAHLRSIYLAALSMDVAVVDDLAITILEELSVETISGDVQFPPKLVPSYKLDSRNIVIHTVSGDIRGNWPLYDSLKLGSNSGDIAGEVEPQAVLDSRPLPAVLEVSSVSGDISIKEPIERAYQSAKPDTVIYPRDYITIIDTKSGTVRAWVAFSTAASITTVSGDITATILPVYNVSLMQGVPEPDLRTTTKSGNVAVSALEPLWVEIGRTLSRDGKSPTANPNVPVDIPTNPVPVPQPRIPSIPTVPFIPIGSRDPYRSLPGRLGDLLGKRDATIAALDAPPMRHLKSSHSTISGQVKVRYPGSWEGTINAETISGKISVEGKGVRIESRTQWPKSVKASKGQASACHADIGSTSGDISVLVGEK